MVDWGFGKLPGAGRLADTRAVFQLAITAHVDFAAGSGKNTIKVNKNMQINLDLKVRFAIRNRH
jgi:hypothetical protein